MSNAVTEKTLTTSAIAKLEKEMKFKPFANDAEITLTLAIVRNMLATPTRTGRLPDDNACMRYMMMAKSRALNPFEGDCFLLGFDTKDGPKFEMITAQQAFLKRAEVHKDFDGMESGVIVRDKATGAIQEMFGDFHMDDQELLGGWARVHHKDKKVPTYRRAKLSTYRKSFGRWLDDPAGMIVKVAEADALRSAFPTKLGGLYLREEIELVPQEATVTSTAPPVFDMPQPQAQIEPPKPATTNGVKEPPRDDASINANEVEREEEEVPGLEPLSKGKTTEQVIAAIEELLERDGASVDQLLAHCKIVKLAGPKIEEFRQLADSKLRGLLDNWATTIGQVKEIQV